MTRSDIASLFVATLLLAVFLLGCVSLGRIAPPVDEAMLATIGIVSVADRDQLMRGRDIYLTDCTKCHVAYPIDDYDAEEWLEEISPIMNRKAKLDDAEATAVNAYIFAALKQLATLPAE